MNSPNSAWNGIAVGTLIPNWEMPATAPGSRLEGKGKSRVFAPRHVPVLQPDSSFSPEHLCQSQLDFEQWKQLPFTFTWPTALTISGSKKSPKSFLFELLLNSISPECPHIINTPLVNGRASTLPGFLYLLSNGPSPSSTEAEYIVERHWHKNRFLFTTLL